MRETIYLLDYFFRSDDKKGITESQGGRLLICSLSVWHSRTGQALGRQRGAQRGLSSLTRGPYLAKASSSQQQSPSRRVPKSRVSGPR